MLIVQSNFLILFVTFQVALCVFNAMLVWVLVKATTRHNQRGKSIKHLSLMPSMTLTYLVTVDSHVQSVTTAAYQFHLQSASQPGNQQIIAHNTSHPLTLRFVIDILVLQATLFQVMREHKALAIQEF